MAVTDERLRQARRSAARCQGSSRPRRAGLRAELVVGYYPGGGSSGGAARRGLAYPCPGPAGAAIAAVVVTAWTLGRRGA